MAAKKLKDGFSVITNNMDDKIYLFICILKIKTTIFYFPFEAKWINYYLKYNIYSTVALTLISKPTDGLFLVMNGYSLNNVNDNMRWNHNPI